MKFCEYLAHKNGPKVFELIATVAHRVRAGLLFTAGKLDCGCVLNAKFKKVEKLSFPSARKREVKKILFINTGGGHDAAENSA